MKIGGAVKNFTGEKIFSFNTDQSKLTVFFLNLGAIILMLLACEGMLYLTGILRPEGLSVVMMWNIASFGAFVLTMLMYLSGIFAMVLVHELLHGIVFWIFTKEKPKFGFKIWYAYAAAPEWYFPRWQYVLSALCPLVVITILGIAVFLFVPLIFLPFLFVIIVGNAGGAVGDIYVTLRALLIFKTGSIMINDWGKGAAFFKTGEKK